MFMCENFLLMSHFLGAESEFSISAFDLLVPMIFVILPLFSFISTESYMSILVRYLMYLLVFCVLYLSVS